MMQEIKSCSNDKVKRAVKLQQKKYRTQLKLFIAEGYKVIKDAYDAGLYFEDVFVLKNKVERFAFLGDNINLVDEDLMKKIASTKSAPEAVAVIRQKEVDTAEINDFWKVALVEGIKDAGNLGTIIRSACAFGYDAVVLCGDCIDLYNPKVIRSTVGCFFKIPILENVEIKDVRSLFPKHLICATVVNTVQACDLMKVEIPTKFVMMLGSEADGLSEEALKIADKLVTIKMENNTESLNLGVAASICFYETYKKSLIN